MLILEKPYVSEFLIDTIVQNDWPVLDNDAIQETDIEEGAIDTIPCDIAKNYYIAQEFPLSSQLFTQEGYCLCQVSAKTCRFFSASSSVTAL